MAPNRQQQTTAAKLDMWAREMVAFENIAKLASTRGDCASENHYMKLAKNRRIACQLYVQENPD